MIRRVKGSLQLASRCSSRIPARSPAFPEHESHSITSTTPNAFHAEQAIAAAQAGKHVLCDKPLAISATDAERVLDASGSDGLRSVELTDAIARLAREGTGVELRYPLSA